MTNMNNQLKNAQYAYKIKKNNHKEARLSHENSLSFSDGAQGVQLLSAGWSSPESFGSWSDGKHAVLTLDLGDSAFDDGVKLSVDILPFLPGKVQKRHVSVRIGELPVTEWFFSSDDLDPEGVSKRFLEIQPGLRDAQGFVNIEFDIETPLSPFEAGISQDTRKLGIAILRMEILPLKEDVKPVKKPSPSTTIGSSPLQIYSGYTQDDVEMLSQFVIQKATVEEDRYTDGFGQITLRKNIPFAASTRFDSGRLTLPVPDDGFHAEALEYIALADSVRRAKNSFCAVEIGAGWGPWITLGGVMARHRGIKTIGLVGVEGLPKRYELMKEHLAENGLRPRNAEKETLFRGVRCRILKAAVVSVPSKVFFPDVNVEDMGSTFSTKNTDKDYRGVTVHNIEVEGIPLSDCFLESPIDYLHIDIQGTEYELIESNIVRINDRDFAMMIATHSRTIEGKLIELLYRNGWYLHKEKPCRVDWAHNVPPTLQAMTTVDGCQYWRHV